MMSMISPLQYISDAMNYYAERGALKNLPINAKGEIGQLGRTFEYVTGEVDKRTGQTKRPARKKKEP